MTNLEKIRSMSAEELAGIFFDLCNSGEYCAIPYSEYNCKENRTCKECCLMWLKEEADNGK